MKKTALAERRNQLEAQACCLVPGINTTPLRQHAADSMPLSLLPTCNSPASLHDALQRCMAAAEVSGKMAPNAPQSPPVCCSPVVWYPWMVIEEGH